MSFKCIWNPLRILQEFHFRLLLWKHYDWSVVHLIHFTSFYLLTFQVAILWDKKTDSSRNSVHKTSRLCQVHIQGCRKWGGPPPYFVRAPWISYLATVRIPNNKCAEPMERIRTWELIPTNQNLLYQKTWYNYFPSKIVGLLKAQVWDSIRFQCLWLDRDVKINYRIFMSYIILLHATLQLWQPRKCMTMNFSESYFKKKNYPQHWGWGANQK